ncbi:MAG TPA: NAD(P)H-dependent oxidoreductase [Rhizomicrobium sp.]|nr:NAD(P)H-dependent oxidoreductase [Rhizomicrobium sp.]
MTSRVLIVNGHPDGRPERFCTALADSYAAGAASAGHEVQRLDIARVQFAWLSKAEDFMTPPDQADIGRAQALFKWAQHIVFVYPLWLGSEPALLKGFMEQLSRNGFAVSAEGNGFPKGKLTGRSARLVVTMGMPALFYRLLFGAHGVRAFERSILRLAGFKPVRRSLLGGIDAAPAKRREAWLEDMRRLGARAG